MATKKAPTPSIPDTEDAWNSGALGRDEEFVDVAPDDVDALVNEHMELQPISIRLEKSLIEDFKLIAKIHGLGYQPLMRQILKRFADCEKKRILREFAGDLINNAKKTSPADMPAQPTKQKKAA